MFKLPLSEAAELRSKTDRTPLVYILRFEDGSAYVGSATGIYRLKRHRSVARGTYPSLTKNPLLVNALQSMDCSVEFCWCVSLREARTVEKSLYQKLETSGATLHNCREFGWAGRWIKQDATTRKKRLATISANGRAVGAANGRAGAAKHSQTMKRLHALGVYDRRKSL